MNILADTLIPAPMADSTQFERSEDSPFEDKYSIEKEEKALRDLLETDYRNVSRTSRRQRPNQR